MNDIEKLKKLNQMIPEMKKHGFAETNDEAAKKTEELFHTEFIGKATEVKTSEPVNKIGESRFEKFRQDVESRLTNMESNVSNTISKVNEIVKFVTDFEQKLKQVQQQEVKVQESKVVQQEGISEEKSSSEQDPEQKVNDKSVESKQEMQDQEKKPQENPESKGDINPKNGEFTPKNIDIRDFFNFGK